MGNPVRLVDPDGAEPIDPTNHPRWNFYRTFGHSAFEAVRSAGAANGYKGLYLVAQRRLENGFNENPPGNNPFNIKGSGDMGSISYMTSEFEGGVKVKKPQSFASFSSIQKGLEAQIDLLKRNFPVAHLALTSGPLTIDDYGEGLQDYGRLGGFATDPEYKSKLTNMFNSVKKYYNLYFSDNIARNNYNYSMLSSVLRTGMLTKNQQYEFDRAQQELSIENGRLQMEQERLDEVE